MYEVSELIKGNRKIPRKYFPQKPYDVNNDYEVYRMAKKLSVINREHISSVGELEGKLAAAKEDYEKTRDELNRQIKRQEQLGMIIQKCEEYFSLKDKAELSPAESLRLQMCEQIVKKVNVSDISDIDTIRNMKQVADEQAVALNEKFSALEKKYHTYKDILETYNKISKGDYISNLIEEKRRQDEQEAIKKKKPKGR